MPKQAPRISDPNIEAKWVAAHGEAVTYTKAAQMLSVCNEPLIQVFQQLIADKPGGGFWPYEQVKVTGMQVLGFPPFSSTADLKAKLDGPLARELQERNGLIVTSGHKQNGQRGIRIEPYTRPSAYQTSLPHEG